MESSSYYKSKMEKFKTLKSQLEGLYTYVDACDTSTKKCKSYLDEIIICGESIDRGIIENNVATTVSNISSSVSSLISECRTKIDYYTDMYNKAYRSEQFKAKLKEVFPWI